MRRIIFTIIIFFFVKIALPQDSIVGQENKIYTGGSSGHDFHVGMTFQINDNKNFKNKIIEFGYSRLDSEYKSFVNDKGKRKDREYYHELGFSGVIYFSDKLNFGIILGNRIGFNSWSFIGLNSIINTDFFYYKFIIRPELGINTRPIYRFNLQFLLGIDLPINSNSYYLYNKPTIQLTINFCFLKRLLCWDSF